MTEHMFDHIVVGGGSAGCVVANRLVNAGHTVLLLEAGPHDNIKFVKIPATFVRVIGTERSWILFDEPGAGLDEHESKLLRKAIAGIPARFGAQVLLIDHDVDLIAATCAETLVMDFGRHLALGPTRTVLDDPAVRQAYLGT